MSDEGIWILDPAKNRICLFTPDGKLLKSVHGVTQVASDLALDANGEPWIIDVEFEGELLHLADGMLEPHDMDSPVERLVTTPHGGLFGLTDVGFGGIAVPEGTPSSGLPATGEEVLTDETRGNMRALSLGDRWTNEIEFAPATRPKSVYASLSSDPSVDATSLYLGFEVGSPSEAPNRENPLYLLVMSLQDGQVVETRRVQRSTLDTTNQVTHFAVHDGQVYQLVLTQSGAEIRRMPPRL